MECAQRVRFMHLLLLSRYPPKNATLYSANATYELCFYFVCIARQTQNLNIENREEINEGEKKNINISRYLPDVFCTGETGNEK